MAGGAINPSTGTSASSSTSGTKKSDQTLRGLNMDQFLNLMITELQNQDPLNPTDNDKLLQQLGQIRNIGATEQLSQTLDSVLLGQNVTNASALIGKRVDALSADGKPVNGVVDRVTIEDKAVKLHVGSDEAPISNVRAILPG